MNFMANNDYKYIRKYKNEKGNWVYVYDTGMSNPFKRERTDIKYNEAKSVRQQVGKFDEFGRPTAAKLSPEAQRKARENVEAEANKATTYANSFEGKVRSGAANVERAMRSTAKKIDNAVDNAVDDVKKAAKKTKKKVTDIATKTVSDIKTESSEAIQKATSWVDNLFGKKKKKETTTTKITTSKPGKGGVRYKERY